MKKNLPKLFTKHLLPENLKPAVGAFPRWIIIADTATAKSDLAFFHFSFGKLFQAYSSPAGCKCVRQVVNASDRL